jgi:hypothetical protein
MTFLDDFPAASLPIIVQALQLGLKGFVYYTPPKIVNYIELPHLCLSCLYHCVITYHCLPFVDFCVYHIGEFIQ